MRLSHRRRDVRGLSMRTPAGCEWWWSSARRSPPSGLTGPAKGTRTYRTYRAWWAWKRAHTPLKLTADVVRRLVKPPPVRPRGRPLTAAQRLWFADAIEKARKEQTWQAFPSCRIVSPARVVGRSQPLSGRGRPGRASLVVGDPGPGALRGRSTTRTRACHRSSCRTAAGQAACRPPWAAATASQRAEGSPSRSAASVGPLYGGRVVSGGSAGPRDVW